MNPIMGEGAAPGGRGSQTWRFRKHTSLRRESACAMVVAYSGMLIAPALLKNEIKSRPRVLLVHGEADQAAPLSGQQIARKALESNDVPVTTEAREGLGYRIDEIGISLGIDSLAKALRTN